MQGFSINGSTEVEEVKRFLDIGQRDAEVVLKVLLRLFPDSHSDHLSLEEWANVWEQAKGESQVSPQEYRLMSEEERQAWEERWRLCSSSLG